jgi:phosphoribosyl-ATP pyrophosphohydrolase/phosphoribosyl-AMP cyclohydrolase
MANLIENGRQLYPVTVQSALSGRVLMMAFADDDALNLTRETKLAHFYSRSRQQLWKKGESSGHLLPVETVLTDCDGDSYLYLAHPIHPVCHRDTPGCFDDAPETFESTEADTILRTLAGWIHARAIGPSDPTSYTQRLLAAAIDRPLKKIAEESGEVIIAALSPGDQQTAEVVWESADLLFHLAVVWERLGIRPEQVADELIRRHRPEPQPG